MIRKNLLALHEAIVFVLTTQPDRTASFRETAKFISNRNLFSKRKDNIELEKLVTLHSTKSEQKYSHLFEKVEQNKITIEKHLNLEQESSCNGSGFLETLNR